MNFLYEGQAHAHKYPRSLHLPYHMMRERGFSCQPSHADPTGTHESRRKLLLYHLINVFAATLPQNSSTSDTTLSLDLTLDNQSHFPNVQYEV